jgi:histidinol-phosphatase (PHP family)
MTETAQGTALLYEMHMHTPLCHHAVGEPGDYAAAAEQRGLAGIVVTCHSPGPDGWSPHVRMADSDWADYVALVDEARDEWAGRVDVRLGLESDYAPGHESWLEALHARAPLHHVLGSVHCQLPDWLERYGRGDDLAVQRTYFEHLALAAESGLFDTLAHPDLVKNSFPGSWQIDAVADTIQASLDRIAAAGTAMELNTSGLQKMIPEMNPSPTMLGWMRERDIPVVLGADAHTPRRVAGDFEAGLDLLDAAGYTHVSNVLDRQRRDFPIAAARASLRPGM